MNGHFSILDVTARDAFLMMDQTAEHRTHPFHDGVLLTVLVPFTLLVPFTVYPLHLYQHIALDKW